MSYSTSFSDGSLFTPDYTNGSDYTASVSVPAADNTSTFWGGIGSAATATTDFLKNFGQVAVPIAQTAIQTAAMFKHNNSRDTQSDVAQANNATQPNYTPWIIGGVAVLGLAIISLMMLRK